MSRLKCLYIHSWYCPSYVDDPTRSPRRVMVPVQTKLCGVLIAGEKGHFEQHLMNGWSSWYTIVLPSCILRGSWRRSRVHNFDSLQVRYSRAYSCFSRFHWPKRGIDNAANSSKLRESGLIQTVRKWYGSHNDLVGKHNFPVSVW